MLNYNGLIMTTGIHHVTAISGQIARTLDFYRRALGLRLVKRTVNYDDPATYHLYFGDEVGRPGTILTFFPWPDGGRGQIGRGQVAVRSLTIPQQSLGFWMARLISAGIRYEGPSRRFGPGVLALGGPGRKAAGVDRPRGGGEAPGGGGGGGPGEPPRRGGP